MMRAIDPDIAYTDNKIGSIHAEVLRIHKEKPHEAVALLDEAAVLSEQIRNFAMHVLSTWRKGATLRSIGKVNEAEVCFNKALELAKNYGLRADEAGIVNSLGNCYLEQGKFTGALNCYLHSAEVYRQLNRIEDQAAALGNAGHAAYLQGEILSAIRHCRQAMNLCEEYGIPIPISVYIHAGISYQVLGESERSLDYFLRALKASEHNPNPSLRASALSNIGVLYFERGKFGLSIEYIRQAIDAFANLEFDLQLLTVYILQLAAAYFKTGNREEAAYYLDRAGSMARQLALPLLDCTLNITMAEYEELLGNYDRARDYYLRTIEIVKGFDGDSEKEIISLRGLARLVSGDEREGLLRQALAIAQAKNLRNIESEVSLELSSCLDEMGKPTEALLYYRHYHTTSEQINNENSERRIQVLQLEYEVEQLRNELAQQHTMKEEAEREAERRKEELNRLSLELGHISQVVKNIRYHARRGLHMSSGKTRLCFRQIIQASGVQMTPLQWDIFETRFSRSYGDFIERLNQKYPELSPAEIKICSLLKAGTSLKDTSSLLCISTRTLQNQCSSIRRKLGLSARDNLSSHLLSL